MKFVRRKKKKLVGYGILRKRLKIDNRQIECSEESFSLRNCLTIQSSNMRLNNYFYFCHSKMLF